MNVLFYRYGSICEPDIIEVFNKMGINVYEDTQEMYDKACPSSQKLATISAVLCEHPVDFIFSLNFFPFLSELCERLHLLYVCWSVDCPVLELFSTSIRNRCNRIFLFDYKQYETFYPQNPEGIFYLPLATHVARWDDVLEHITEEDRQQYSSEVSFVGSLYHEKSPLSEIHGSSSLPEFWKGYVKGLIESQLKVYGYNLLEDAIPEALIQSIKDAFPDFYCMENTFTNIDRYVAAHYYLGMHASEIERIRALNGLAEQFQVALYTRSNTTLLKNVTCRGGVTTHVEMPKIFHSSKINLNITIKPIQTGLSLRVWDILGCGGFLLSNYQAEIPDYFEIGRDLDCYESLADLKEKVRFYLTHEDIRREIADNGYRKVKAFHSYEARIATMLKMLFNI